MVYLATVGLTCHADGDRFALVEQWLPGGPDGPRGDEALAVSRRCGFDGPAEFVMYGINTEVFFPRARPPAPQAARPFRLGYVGRLVPEKGLDDVLLALHQSPAAVELTMLGDGPERAGLLARAAALGLGGRVHLMEPRSPDGVAEFMSGLDALVLMSRTTRT